MLGWVSFQLIDFQHHISIILPLLVHVGLMMTLLYLYFRVTFEERSAMILTSISDYYLGYWFLCLVLSWWLIGPICRFLMD